MYEFDERPERDDRFWCENVKENVTREDILEVFRLVNEWDITKDNGKPIIYDSYCWIFTPQGRTDLEIYVKERD